jgi:hypothetical protein
MRLVRFVWEHQQEDIGHSWARLNSSMAGAVTLAISAGMTFALDDFSEIYSGMRGGHWFGVSGADMMGEEFYFLAVELRHLSACKSFEQWKGREPMIFSGNRLAVGSDLKWNGFHFRVTSINKNGIVAVFNGTPRKIVKLTREKLLEASRFISKSKKNPEAVFCFACGKECDLGSKCSCGSAIGVLNGRVGTLTLGKAGNK